jgi:putative membrane protein
VQIPTPVAQLVRGFAMGSADIVPGVSGGTVALVVGIYDRLIDNVREGARGLKQLLTGRFGEFADTVRRIEWVWLVSLLIGVVAAIFALSSVIERLLHEQPIRMGAIFFGLIVGSIYVAFRLLDRVDGVSVALMVGVGATMFFLLGLRSDTEVADDALEVVTEPWWVFLLAGSIAICAMILPGVSGSFLLVMLGMYTEVLGAVNDRDFAVLGAFVVGCVIGLALFSTLLHWLLDRYHRWVIAAMIGLLLGSLRVVWAWPNGTNTTTLALPRDDVLVPLLLMAAAIALVVGVDLLARRYVTVQPLHHDEPAVEPSR